MKITILTQYYPPEHGAPQNRLHDLAKRWAEAGEDITVITAMPNYPKGEVFAEYRGKLFCKEEIDNVRVIRSAILASKKKGMFRQLTAYFSFVFSSLIVAMFKLGKQDFIICESPPLFLGLTALILKFFKRSKLVMNISDLWPESALQLGMIRQGIALSVLERFEQLLYDSSVVVSCQTEGIIKGVKMRSPDTDTLLFPNGVDLEMFQPAESNVELRKSLEIPDGFFVVGYGGNHGRSQALVQVLDAADMLREKKIYFALFGDGPEKDELVLKAREMKLENLRFYPSQNRHNMSEIQALWDLALVPLKDIDIFDGARPSKMFELMAGEIPFIFCGRGEGAELVEESGSGIVVPPENSKKLSKAIDAFASLPQDVRAEKGRAGGEFVRKNFNRATLASSFLSHLKNINRET